MSDGQQKNRQMELAFEEQLRGEAPTRFLEGAELSMATPKSQSPALTAGLMEEVCETKNVKKALKKVRANKGSPGVDGMTVKELPVYLKENWPTIREQLLTGTYKPKAVRKVEIPKPTGGKRKLSIPCVLDRFIQQAVQQVLQQHWDHTFSEYSYGFRPGRSAHHAIAQAQIYVADGYDYVVDLDLEKFFDQVNHDMLMGRMAKRIADKRALRLTRAFLNAGLMDGGLTSPTKGRGVPQGGPLSPILSNLFLDDFDRELERRGHRFVRYADDCNIYVRSEKAGQRVMESIKRFITNKLKLKVNEAKSAVAKPEQRKFLGYTVIRGRTGAPKRAIAPQARKKFKKRVRRITRRTGGRSIKQVVKELASYLVGWRGYFGFCETPWELRDLDSWIRRRLRSLLWKQWKTYRCRRDNLKRLGVRWQDAVRCAWKSCEGSGPWHMSRSRAAQSGLSTSYFTALGLPKLCPT